MLHNGRMVKHIFCKFVDKLFILSILVLMILAELFILWNEYVIVIILLVPFCFVLLQNILNIDSRPNWLDDEYSG